MTYFFLVNYSLSIFVLVAVLERFIVFYIWKIVKSYFLEWLFYLRDRVYLVFVELDEGFLLLLYGFYYLDWKGIAMNFAYPKIIIKFTKLL